MTGKKDELTPKDLEQAQGGAGFKLEAQKTGNRTELGEVVSGGGQQSGTDPIDEQQLIAMRGGAGFETSSKKVANRSELGGEPKYVIQDPWGGPGPDPEPEPNPKG